MSWKNSETITSRGSRASSRTRFSRAARRGGAAREKLLGIEREFAPIRRGKVGVQKHAQPRPAALRDRHDEDIRARVAAGALAEVVPKNFHLPNESLYLGRARNVN